MGFDISKFDEYRENNRLEVKKAKGGLPNSLWKTYSSMANCYGGMILLGVAEQGNGSFVTTGLKDVEKLRKDFWNTVNNSQKVSVNLLTDEDVTSYEVDWTGNLFDFFFRVYPKLVKDLKIPFKLEGITRIDDTPVHKALREALANCLVNTDFFLARGVVIKKEIDEFIMENPGSIRTGKDQMLKGGISDPRNKTLMKMFNMIGIGERAGSGVPDIYAVWESQGWKEPMVEEQYNPDRTILKLSLVKKQAEKTSEKKWRKKVAKKK